MLVTANFIRCVKINTPYLNLLCSFPDNKWSWESGEYGAMRFFVVGGGLRFLSQHHVGLIKQGEGGGVSSLDVALRNACSVSGGKSETKIPPGGPRQRWKVNTQTIIMK
jgi:hypothetical protein